MCFARFLNWIISICVLPNNCKPTLPNNGKPNILSLCQNIETRHTFCLSIKGKATDTFYLLLPINDKQFHNIFNGLFFLQNAFQCHKDDIVMRSKRLWPPHGITSKYHSTYNLKKWCTRVELENFVLIWNLSKHNTYQTRAVITQKCHENSSFVSLWTFILFPWGTALLMFIVRRQKFS